MLGARRSTEQRINYKTFKGITETMMAGFKTRRIKRRPKMCFNK